MRAFASFHLVFIIGCLIFVLGTLVYGVVMAEHNLLGNKGEMLASRYLMNEGFAVLHYNWRSGHKEIDLVARERDTLVFVEVKSRRNEFYGNAADAVTPQKIDFLISAADAYVKRYGIDLKVRFDIVTVIGVCEPYRIEHVRDAFRPEW